MNRRLIEAGTAMAATAALTVGCGSNIFGEASQAHQGTHHAEHHRHHQRTAHGFKAQHANKVSHSPEPLVYGDHLTPQQLQLAASKIQTIISKRGNAITAPNSNVKVVSEARTVQMLNPQAIQHSGESTRVNGSRAAKNSNDFIIGDSISERAAAAYRQVFAADHRQITIDASSSRSLTAPGQDPGNTTNGFQAIQNDRAEIARADDIVLALGSNGGDSATNVATAVRKIRGENSQASIYLVNTITVGRTDNYNNEIIGPANQVIDRVTKQLGVHVIDWFNQVDPTGNPEHPSLAEQDPYHYIDNDGLGVHPTPAGSLALARLVEKVTALTNPTPQTEPAMAPTCQIETTVSGQETLDAHFADLSNVLANKRVPISMYLYRGRPDSSTICPNGTLYIP